MTSSLPQTMLPDATAGSRFRSARVTTMAGVILLTLLALGIRLHGLNRELWLDEFTTAWVVRDGLGAIFERCTINNLSPAYFLIVRLSVELLGYSAAGLRLPSIVASTLLVPAVYFLARRMSVSRSLSLTACLLTALNPACVEFSLAVRAYAVAQLAVALQVGAFFVMIEGNDAAYPWQKCGRTALFALLTAACVYLHSVSALIVLPEVTFGLVLVATTRTGAFDRIRTVLAGLVLAGILCLPLLPYFRSLTGARRVLGSFVGNGSWVNALGRFRVVDYFYVPFPLALLADFVLRRRGAGVSDCPQGTRAGYGFTFCLLWLLLPSLFAVAATNLDLARINVGRWLAFAAVAPILMAVTAASFLAARASRILFIGIIFVTLHVTGDNRLDRMLAGSLPVFEGSAEYRGYGERVAYINRECRDDRLILVESRLVEAQWLEERTDELLRDYLLCTVNSLYVIDRDPPGRIVAPFRGRNAEFAYIYKDLIARDRGCVLLMVNEADPDEVEKQMAAMFMDRRKAGHEPVIIVEKLIPRVLRVRVSFL